MKKTFLQYATKINPFPLCLSSFSGKFETVTWAQVNRKFNIEYGCVLSLFDLICSIPATSLACERGYIHVKQVKSDHRTLLNESTLSDCFYDKVGRLIYR